MDKKDRIVTRGVMRKAEGVLREFADMHNLTFVSFNDGYKALLNGSVYVHFYLNKMEYRVEGENKRKKLPFGYTNLHKVLSRELKCYGKGQKVQNMVRIVR